MKSTKKLVPMSSISLRPKKLFVLNPKYSHTDEIDERLQFLKYLAQVSTDYQVSKSELDILYSLLVTKSRIPSD
jgi:hypothetical protein